MPYCQRHVIAERRYIAHFRARLGRAEGQHRRKFGIFRENFHFARISDRPVTHQAIFCLALPHIVAQPQRIQRQEGRDIDSDAAVLASLFNVADPQRRGRKAILHRRPLRSGPVRRDELAILNFRNQLLADPAEADDLA